MISKHVLKARLGFWIVEGGKVALFAFGIASVLIGVAFWLGVLARFAVMGFEWLA